MSNDLTKLPFGLTQAQIDGAANEAAEMITSGKTTDLAVAILQRVEARLKRTQQSECRCEGWACDHSDGGPCKSCDCKIPHVEPVQAQPQDDRTWWREALTQLTNSYEAQARVATASGDNATASHYGGLAHGVLKAYEKLNLVEQRRPTVQAKGEPNRIAGSLCDRHRSAVNSCGDCL